MSETKRIDGREANELRPLHIVAGVNPFAEASAEVALGVTRVMLTATVIAAESKSNPEALSVSLEMLPRATHVTLDDPETRNIVRGELDSIEEVLTEALLSCCPKGALEGIHISIHGSVLCADSGILTAAVAGAWVTLAKAVAWASNQRLITLKAKLSKVAAIASGTLGGTAVHDLCAEEAAAAEFVNYAVFSEKKEVILLKAKQERAGISPDSMQALLESGATLAEAIFEVQEKAVA